MNRKLISLAVAAAVTAPAAALADATLYGKAHVSIDWFDIKAIDYKGWGLNKGKIGKGNSRANRFGVKGSEDLGAGLKAIYQVEFGIPLANERNYHIADGEFKTKSGETGLKMRNSYVGLKGDFGTFLVGRHDTPLKISTSKLELFNDTMADYEGTVGFDDIRADNTILYVTPSFSGFQFAAATIPGSASTRDGLRNRKSDSLSEGYSLAATYGNGPWYFGAAYEVLTDQLSTAKANVDAAKADVDAANAALAAATTTADITVANTALADANAALATANAATADTADFKKWRVGLGIRDLSGFYLSAIYEKQKAVDFVEKINGKDNDADLWQGQLGYAFGNNMIKGMYGKNKPDIGDETKSWAVGFDHSFSKRTKAYILYTKVDKDTKGSDEGDWKGFSLGMIHDF
ncbi:porin [Candidatus Thiosymbion oneisti]|uniref:porin n=1 Tax=Candidatus Thiosymbion oneisti TaxID=589554 RepID=UPI0010621CD9|nr:porin [Candidatus Thiosymbion oneisti]